MKRIKISLMIIAAMIIAGCKKEVHVHSSIMGDYSGHLVAVYANELYHTSTDTITDTVNISFSNTTFGASSIPIPTPHEQYFGSADTGTYIVIKDSLMLENHQHYPENFDHNLILRKNYRVLIKSDSLILERITGDGNTYTYRLKKH